MDSEMAADENMYQILDSMECLEIVKSALKLSNFDEIKLIDYKITQGSRDLVGLMGEYYNLKICIRDKSIGDETRQLQFFVKTVPILNDFLRDECERKGFFQKETYIYKHILPNVQKYASSKLFPECYYSRPDIIVMEDLSLPEIGFRHLARNESATIQHCQLMLRHLAKLHAGSIAWELKEEVNIGEKFKDVLFELQFTTRNAWYITGAKGIVFLARRHPNYHYPSAQKFIDSKLMKILTDVDELVNPSTEFRNVLCHRDSWDRNILFKYNSANEPIECCIVDFQLTRYSPPAIDVLFFLYVTLSRDERERAFDQYLDYYYNALQSTLKELSLDENIITEEEFLNDCKKTRLAAIILWAISEPLLKMPEGVSNKVRTEDPERFEYYMNKERTEFIEQTMDLDANYKEIIMEPIKELMEYVFENEENNTSS